MKYFISYLLSFSLVLAPAFAFADTNTRITVEGNYITNALRSIGVGAASAVNSLEVNSLVQELQNLGRQSSASAVQANLIVNVNTGSTTLGTSTAITFSTSTPIQCLDFARTLNYGLHDDYSYDVTKLQTFLVGKGFTYLSPTGYFGKDTRRAVQEWQSESGLPPAAVIGPMSRKLIHDLTCSTSIGTSTQSFFSTSSTTNVFMGRHRPGDLNGDGKVDIEDMRHFTNIPYGARMGNSHFDPNADLNGDGVINFQDLRMLSEDIDGSSSPANQGQH